MRQGLESKLTFRLFLLMALLLSLILFWSTAAESEEIQYVPSGWRTPATGYWMTEQAGRDILTGWKVDREQKEIYRASLDESQIALDTLKETVTAEFAAIKKAHEEDRAQWKKELRRAKAPGIGIFAGPAYGFSSQKIELVVGAGLVWKLW